jgi:hypothetical protein
MVNSVLPPKKQLIIIIISLKFKLPTISSLKRKLTKNVRCSNYNFPALKQVDKGKFISNPDSTKNSNALSMFPPN